MGFGVDYNQDPNWAMFSVKGDGTFNARTRNGGPETPLPANLLALPAVAPVMWLGMLAAALGSYRCFRSSP